MLIIIYNNKINFYNKSIYMFKDDESGLDDDDEENL